MNASFMKSIDKNLNIRVICYEDIPHVVVFVILKDDPTACHHPTLDYDTDGKIICNSNDDLNKLIPAESIHLYYQEVSELIDHQFDIEFLKEHYQVSSFELMEQLRSE